VASEWRASVERWGGGGWVGREGYETAKDVMYTCAARIGGIT
jgi:hypothetical protein